MRMGFTPTVKLLLMIRMSTAKCHGQQHSLIFLNTPPPLVLALHNLSSTHLAYTACGAGWRRGWGRLRHRDERGSRRHAAVEAGCQQSSCSPCTRRHLHTYIQIFNEIVNDILAPHVCVCTTYPLLSRSQGYTHRVHASCRIF